MARFASGGIASAAATATLPAVTLAGAAAGGGRLRELGIFNTTPTAFYASLRLFSTAGTRGAAVNSICLSRIGATANCNVADANTSTAPTLVNGVIRLIDMPAQIGGGVIWTFGDTGFEISAATSSMLGILCPSGTGQVFTYYFEWDE